MTTCVLSDLLSIPGVVARAAFVGVFGSTKIPGFRPIPARAQPVRESTARQVHHNKGSSAHETGDAADAEAYRTLRKQTVPIEMETPIEAQVDTNTGAEQDTCLLDGYVTTWFDLHSQPRAGVVYRHLYLESRRDITLLPKGRARARRAAGNTRQLLLETARPLSLGKSVMVPASLSRVEIRLSTERLAGNASMNADGVPLPYPSPQETLGMRSRWWLDTETPGWVAANISLVRAWGHHLKSLVNIRLADGTGDVADMLDVNQGRTVKLMSMRHTPPRDKGSQRPGYHRHWWWHHRDTGRHHGPVSIRFKRESGRPLMA